MHPLAWWTEPFSTQGANTSSASVYVSTVKKCTKLCRFDVECAYDAIKIFQCFKLRRRVSTCMFSVS